MAPFGAVFILGAVAVWPAFFWTDRYGALCRTTDGARVHTLPPIARMRAPNRLTLRACALGGGPLMVDYDIARAKYMDAFIEAIKWSEVSKRFGA